MKRVPLYKQIEQYILDQIRINQWQPHHKLPSESELAGKFKVSRLTVKKALQSLTESGLIYRIQGKGSFLSSNYSGEPLAYPIDHNVISNKLVALIVPQAKTIRSLHLLNGIEDELSKHGYRVLFCKTYNSKQLEKEIIQDVVRRGVSGIIIYPVEGENYSEEILRLSLNQFPLVIVDRNLRGIDTNCVSVDNIQGAFDATNHLINLMHTRIGFVSTHIKDTSSIEDRLNGYENALAENNIPVDHRLRIVHFHVDQVNEIIEKGSVHEAVKQELTQFLQQNPDITAIFAVNSAIGLSIIEVALELGLRIPEDLSVVFFDEYEHARFSKIPPTCVNQHEYRIGSEAARMIASIIENPEQQHLKIKIPAELVVRGSTAIARS